MFGAAAMSLSSFCVVTNALRLNLFKVFDAYKDRPRGKRSQRMADAVPADGQIQDNTQPAGGKDDENMKTMYIDGMMCTHCEARVKKALEAVKGVVSAEVSHDAGTARVLLSEDVPDDVLKKRLRIRITK